MVRMTARIPIVARPDKVIVCAGGGVDLSPEDAEAFAAELLMRAFDARKMGRLVKTASRGMIVKA